ncbi:EcsC family protein [Bacillus sp. FJAT-45037]|uniref:EcsC family protein n=1 Tax=Bacillus sp. FJAT-45037 TaxID=2011007 RepID=UPI000C2361CA|nr:EcsC family protein [Bacillus sp. FJAT-45037]
MTKSKEQHRLESIREWERTYFDYEPTDVEYTYLKWSDKLFEQLGPTRKEKVVRQLDHLFIHLHAWLQNTRSHEEVKKRIIQYAQVFDPAVVDSSDMRDLSMEQLNYMTEQLMAKQRLLSLSQGGLTGMGGMFLLAADLPAAVAINLRSIQQIACIYGYDLKRPDEMVIALKLFHLATLPKAFQAHHWDKLWSDLEGHNVEDVFYGGEGEVIEPEWLQHFVRQIAKSFVITMLRKKMIQGLPLIGMAVGAGLNYRLSQQVIEVAHKFYQKRLLIERIDR